MSYKVAQNEEKVNKLIKELQNSKRVFTLSPVQEACKQLNFCVVCFDSLSYPMCDRCYVHADVVGRSQSDY